jgi:hypothetical protein
MSDRKYRQRGYMDDERDRPPRPAQGPKGESGPPRPRGDRPEGPRAYDMPSFRDIVRCSRCGNQVTSAIALDSRCGKCGTDMHSCAQCASFSPGSRFECMQQIPARITPKDARNNCTLYAPRTTVERETGSTAPTGARKAFDDLFK